ncbi:MAG: FeoB-associated Cys-rich membrane protein [Sphingobacteriaceae bacterium]|jgi:hypothetical protein
MIQNIIAIALLIVAVFFIVKKVFKPTTKPNCGDDCSCH